MNRVWYLIKLAEELGFNVSRLMGKSANVLPIKKPNLTKSGIKIETATDQALDNELTETINLARNNKLSGQELEQSIRNLENIKAARNAPQASVYDFAKREQVSPEGIKTLIQEKGQIAKPGTPMGNVETRVKQLEAKVKEKGMTLDDVMKDVMETQKTASKLQDEGLVRAAVRYKMMDDVKRGTLKLPKNLEDVVRGASNEEDVITVFRNNYGEAALEQVDSLVPDFYKMTSPTEAVKKIETTFPDIKPKKIEFPETVDISKLPPEEFAVGGIVADKAYKLWKGLYEKNQDAAMMHNKAEEFKKIYDQEKQKEQKATGGRVGFAEAGRVSKGLDYLTGIERRGYANGTLLDRYKEILNEIENPEETQTQTPYVIPKSGDSYEPETFTPIQSSIQQQLTPVSPLDEIVNAYIRNNLIASTLQSLGKDFLGLTDAQKDAYSKFGLGYSRSGIQDPMGYNVFSAMGNWAKPGSASYSAYKEKGMTDEEIAAMRDEIMGAPTKADMRQQQKDYDALQQQRQQDYTTLANLGTIGIGMDPSAYASHSLAAMGPAYDDPTERSDDTGPFGGYNDFTGTEGTFTTDTSNTGASQAESSAGTEASTDTEGSFATGGIARKKYEKGSKPPKEQTTIPMNPMMDEGFDPSKRGFLKGAAAVGTGITALGMGAFRLAKKGAKKAKDLDIIVRKTLDSTDGVYGEPTYASWIYAQLKPYSEKSKKLLDKLVKEGKVQKEKNDFFIDINDVDDPSLQALEEVKKLKYDVNTLDYKLNPKTNKTEKVITKIEDLRKKTSDNPFFFEDVIGRIDNFESEAAEAAVDILQPKSAKEIIRERADMIERELKQKGKFANGGLGYLQGL